MTVRRRFPAISSVPVVYELRDVQMVLGLTLLPARSKRSRRRRNSWRPTPAVALKVAA